MTKKLIELRFATRELLKAEAATAIRSNDDIIAYIKHNHAKLFDECKDEILRIGFIRIIGDIWPQIKSAVGDQSGNLFFTLKSFTNIGDKKYLHDDLELSDALKIKERKNNSSKSDNQIKRHEAKVLFEILKRADVKISEARKIVAQSEEFTKIYTDRMNSFINKT